MPVDGGNAALADPEFGAKMHQFLAEVKAEAAYFALYEGERTGYMFVDITDASQIPGIAEPLFLWLKAAIEIVPVMTPEDLGKAGPSIASAMKKWG